MKTTTNSTKTPKAKVFNVIRYTWTLFGLWTVIVVGLLVQEYLDTQSSAIEIAINTARAHLDKDKSFRFWGSLHGGVYVPIREDTPPNPYLSGMTERDIVTNSGRHLTLLNPEYMLRHLNETFSELYGVAGHITSLTPLRPENRPDAWERAALNKFNTGTHEVMEIITSPGEPPYLRLLQPLYVKSECLNCHGHQGYRVGDIRGGVGISLPMSGLFLQARRQFKLHAIPFLVLWLLGSTGIFIGLTKLQKKTAKLALSNIDLQHEVEERKKVEIALQRESSFTAAVLDTAGALITVLDKRGRIIRFNQTCELVTGFRASEIYGKTFWEVLAPPEEAEKMQSSFAHINEIGLPKRQIGQIVTKNNKLRIIDWANTTFTAEDGVIEYVICIGVDTTEEKQLQVQLLHATKLAAVGKLAASIAHEINNPLFGIRNVLERLKEKAALDPGNLEFAELAIQECDRIKNLVRSLQDFNRPSAGVITSVNIHHSLDSMLLLIKKDLENRNITILRNYSNNLQPINAIADQIKQVILNLLNNAIEAIQQDGKITITTNQSAELVLIDFTDTGTGIDNKSLPHIFEPFFTTKPTVKGTGLGLSVSYGIIKSHGGTISVDNTLMRGTTFSIALPISGASPYENT
jgi:PAS domain S-box-containing protein